MVLKTIQTGAKRNTKSFENFSYWLGGVDVTDQNLDQFNPYIQGVSRIFMYKVPAFMKVLDPDMTRRFKTIVETGATSISGIGNLSSDFVEFQGGFAGQRFNNISSVTDDTDTLTIQVYELSGSPIREFLDTWMTGVRDPRSGIAHYHGAVKTDIGNTSGGSGETVLYGERSHTAEFVYTTMDPTGLDLEYSCLWAHCFPTTVDKSHLNYETGNRANVQMNIEFRTTKYESPAINDVGNYFLLNSKVEYNYLEFNPNITPELMKPTIYSYGNSSGNATTPAP
jgi:hypothetical protein